MHCVVSFGHFTHFVKFLRTTRLTMFFGFGEVAKGVKRKPEGQTLYAPWT